MSDPSQKSVRQISKVSRKPISSQALEDGRSLFDSLDGQTTDLPGPEAAHVSPSRPQARRLGETIRATFGQRGFGSSKSADLQHSLENRLQQRFNTDGSILFSETWKELIMPAGRVLWAHTASARHTSGSECGSWPTPIKDDGKNESRLPRELGYKSVSQVAQLIASWPTPTVQSGDQTTLEPTDNQTGGNTLGGVAKLTSWATPTSRDHKDGDSKNVPINSLLGRQVTLASWSTPRAEERQQHNSQDGYQALSLQVLGPISNGSNAETENRGQLNAAFSRWLMGYPVEWCQAAIRVYRMRTKRAKRE